MTRKPRPISDTFFSWKELTTSVIQGLMITVGTLAVYQYAVYKSFNEDTTRTMVFVALISANILLTLVNRSFRYSILTTSKYKNILVPLIILVTMILTALVLFVPVLNRFFDFQRLNFRQILIALVVGSVSVIWYEFVKGYKRIRDKT